MRASLMIQTCKSGSSRTAWNGVIFDRISFLDKERTLEAPAAGIGGNALTRTEGDVNKAANSLAISPNGSAREPF